MTQVPTSYRRLDGETRSKFWTLLPWTGLISLALAAACALAALAVGIVSNGLPQNSWRVQSGSVQPSVLLSFAATIANTLLRVAFAEGATIQWWRMAQHGLPIGTLQAAYDHAFSAKTIFSTWSHFSRISLAAFVMLILLVDGPFLQRASSVTSLSITTANRLSIPVSSSPMTQGATALITTHDGYAPNIFTSAYAEVAKAYSARAPISMPRWNTSSIAEMEILAPGWDINCISNTTQFKVMSMKDWMDQYENRNNYTGPASTQTMFKIEAVYNTYTQYTTGSGINFTSSFKSEPGDTGKFVQRHCVLREAIVRYPIRISNGTVTLLDMPLNKNRTEQIVIRAPESNTWSSAPSTLGGLFLTLSGTYETLANITQKGGPAGGTISIYNKNIMANQFIVGSDSTTNNVYWTDPTDSIMSAANELFFRTAVALTDKSSIYCNKSTCAQPEVMYPNLTLVNRTLAQNVNATMTNSLLVYKTDLAWLISGCTIILLACITVGSMYMGWTELDRDHGINPLETAKAFDAPLLRDADARVRCRDWPEHVKQTRIQYGVVGSSPNFQMPTDYPVGSDWPKHATRTDSWRDKPLPAIRMDGKGGYEMQDLENANPNLNLNLNHSMNDGNIPKFRKMD